MVRWILSDGAGACAGAHSGDRGDFVCGACTLSGGRSGMGIVTQLAAATFVFGTMVLVHIGHIIMMSDKKSNKYVLNDKEQVLWSTRHYHDSRHTALGH